MNEHLLSAYRVLTAPGLHGSGPAHWQSRWENRFPDFVRVEQDDWETPDLSRWSQRLSEVLEQSSQPTLVVAHSFGCLTTIAAAGNGRFNLAGALLVAPADPDKFSVADRLYDVRLDFPAIVIGSTNDPWMESARAAIWADRWGAGFLNAGALGHINAESGLGDWEQGLHQFSQLLDMAESLRHPQAAMPAR